MKRALLMSWLVAATLAASASAQTSTVVLDGFTFLKNGTGGVYWTDLFSAASAEAFDIVIMGDGYTLAQQTAFETTAKNMVSELWDVEPYASRKCAFNVWSVRLVSDVSGVTGPPYDDTPLHGKLATSSQPSTYITADRSLCDRVCTAAGLTGVDAIVVVANEAGKYAAWTHNGLVCTTSKYAWGVLLAHELGHVIAGLADEYACYLCDGSAADAARTYDVATLGIPVQPNLTIYGTEAQRALIPWSASIESWMSIPTTNVNSCNCSHVGAWRGGGTYANGLYRPAEYCVMKQVCHYISAFCAVCESAVKEKLDVDCSAPAVVGDLMAAKETNAKFGAMAPYVMSLIPAVRQPIPMPLPDLIVFVLPPCWECLPQPTPEEKIRINLDGFDASRSRVFVYDERGRQVADAAGSSSGALTVEFDGSRLRTYRVFLAPGTERSRNGSLGVEILHDGVRVFP